MIIRGIRIRRRCFQPTGCVKSSEYVAGYDAIAAFVILEFPTIGGPPSCEPNPKLANPRLEKRPGQVALITDYGHLVQDR